MPRTLRALRISSLIETNPHHFVGMVSLLGWPRCLTAPAKRLLHSEIRVRDRRILVTQMILLNGQEQLGNKENPPTEKSGARWMAELEGGLSLDGSFSRG